MNRHWLIWNWLCLMPLGFRLFLKAFWSSVVWCQLWFDNQLSIIFTYWLQLVLATPILNNALRRWDIMTNDVSSKLWWLLSESLVVVKCSIIWLQLADSWSVDFACQKLATKVVNGDHMTARSCNNSKCCTSVAKCLNHSHVSVCKDTDAASRTSHKTSFSLLF